MSAVQRRTILILLAGAVLAAGSVVAQTQSPILPPDSGYGAWGEYEMQSDSIDHPSFNGSRVYLYYPAGVKKPPALFFSHGIGATDPDTYMALINFCVSKGMALIYSTYKTSAAFSEPQKAYAQLWDGFAAAALPWSDIIDTTRLGFIGHSYGGGATPFVAFKALTEKGWGKSGAFMFIMAPWYSYNTSDSILMRFPPHVKLIMQVYADDEINDHRMAKDIFETVNIFPAEKDFIILFSDTSGQYTLAADHGVPTGRLKFGVQVDLLDYYGIHRLIDALADYTFAGSEEAKAVALGNGDSKQCFMGMWSESDSVRPLSAGDSPKLLHPQTFYANFWSHRVNPRAFVAEKNARIDNSATLEAYAKSPWYKKLVLDKEKVEARSSDTIMDEDDLRCYVPPPDTGFGADGPYQPLERFFPHPTKGNANVHVIIPRGLDTPVPVVLFSPPLWKPSTMWYRGLIDHVASRGNIVIYSTYNYNRFFNQRLRYRVLLDGFAAALELVKENIDTTCVAFIGHAYGGGCVPYVAWHYLSEKKWGRGGAALFIMAPYYAYNISQKQLENFPAHAKLVMQVYEESRKMDWRIAEDIFYNINIHPNEKDFIYVGDAVSEHCEIDADHDAPQAEDRDETNVIDYYAIWRILDALMAYSFTGDAEAKKVALGNGSAEQLFMGRWQDGTPVQAMTVTDRPQTMHKQRAFMFRFKDRLNPRRRLFKPPK